MFGMVIVRFVPRVSSPVRQERDRLLELRWFCVGGGCLADTERGRMVVVTEEFAWHGGTGLLCALWLADRMGMCLDAVLVDVDGKHDMAGLQ